MSPFRTDSEKVAAARGRIRLLVVVLLVVAAGLALNLFKGQQVLGQTNEYRVPPPALSKDIYPCSRCHQNLPVNTTKRKLVKFHTDILLEPPTMQMWCTDCHNPTNLDKLRLASGEAIEFDQVYRLCGQCHGTIYRDWKVGIHGKRVGMWKGDKLYRLCISCHNPHQPAFKAIAPEAPPFRPMNIQTSIK
ncbi:MAG: hypothetical protein C4525_12295 [Desulfarculus sp.]|jgi:hypothetical protein|nr:MAG: hypothetical protein C4525_12295 [Desulfarculus sp.]